MFVSILYIKGIPTKTIYLLGAQVVHTYLKNKYKAFDRNFIASYHINKLRSR